MTSADIDALVLQYVRENHGGRVHVLQKALGSNVPNPRINISRSLQRLKRRGKVRCDRGHWDAVEAPSPWRAAPSAGEVWLSIEAFRPWGPPCGTGYAPWWCRYDGRARVIDLSLDEEGKTVQTWVKYPHGQPEPLTGKAYMMAALWCPVALPPSEASP